MILVRGSVLRNRPQILKGERDLTIRDLWSLVNGVNSLSDVHRVELVIKGSDISNEDFDDLMMALSYISRELNHRGGEVK